MIKIATIICWVCAIGNVVIAILNVRITYERRKAFIEYEEWIESEKMKLIKKLESSVDVVRCKHCIHNGSVDTDCPFGWKDKKFNMPNANDYCSYGEYKEQDHE